MQSNHMLILRLHHCFTIVNGRKYAKKVTFIHIAVTVEFGYFEVKILTEVKVKLWCLVSNMQDYRSS